MPAGDLPINWMSSFNLLSLNLDVKKPLTDPAMFPIFSAKFPPTFLETTLAPQEFLQGGMNMDLIITPSEFTKETLVKTTFTQVDKNTKQEVGKLQLTKPVEVLFEGADLTKYFAESTTAFDLSSVEESFNYLFVGHWMQGNMGQDRKNVGYMIKSFLETYKNKKDSPALILKTSRGNSSVLDKTALLKRIDEIKKTVIRSQHVQRNWDLTKQIPEQDLELLIHAVTNCPSKQNFAFYKVHFITNREKIESIHALTEGLRNMKGEMSTNSQTLANLLVVFEDLDPSQELIDKWKLRDKGNLETLKRDQQMAVGVAAGYLNVIASMLGYGTGCCACYNDEEVKQKIRKILCTPGNIGYVEKKNMVKECFNTIDCVFNNEKINQLKQKVFDIFDTPLKRMGYAEKMDEVKKLL